MYCTQADIKQQIPEAVLVRLTDDEDLGQVDLNRVDGAIKSASDEIDAYARVRYSVPFNPVPGAIKKICVDIAVYNLFSRRGYDEDSADKSVVDRHKAAVKFLENLARGLVTIGVPAPMTESGADMRASRRLFSRRSLEGL